jgi:hypothetical protein
VARDPIELRRYRGQGSFLDGETLEAVQLTVGNFLTVEDWLEANGSEVHLWTNESYVVGLWVFNTWHDRSDKTPAPFGWWAYRTEDGRIGVAAEVSLDSHYIQI